MVVLLVMLFLFKGEDFLNAFVGGRVVKVSVVDEGFQRGWVSYYYKSSQLGRD